MSEFKSLSARDTAEALMALERPLVVMHVNPDGDTVGSGIALVRVLKALGKSALYACAHELPKRLEFILDGEVKATEGLDGYDAVAIDVASPKQLGELEGKITPRLMIDHHEVGTPFADNFIIGGASSAAEVLLSVIDELVAMGKITLTPDIASALYAGISSDTGGFIFSNATAKTMRRAAELIDVGIDSADINHSLFHSKSPDQIKAEGFVASNIKTAMDGSVGYVLIPWSIRAELSVGFGAFDTAIDVVRSLAGVKIAFVIKENEEGAFRASLRSVGADVASVAKSFGGGGHIRAAGCSIEAESIDSAAELLLGALTAVNK